MPSIANHTLTLRGRIQLLLDFIEKNTFYIAIGKPSPWDSTWGTGVSDLNPPSPNRSITQLPEILVYKQVQFAMPAVESNCGDIDFVNCNSVSISNKQWTLINLDDNPKELLYIVEPRKVYLSTTINRTELNSSQFRVVGLYSSPVFRSGVPSNQVLYQSADIESPGLLHWVSFSTPVEAKDIKNTTIELLLSL